MKAIALLNSDQGVSGKFVFTQDFENDPTLITATITGLPRGPHGAHIHTFGDLSGGCATAKDHYNPFDKRHGGPGITERHIGDFGNIISEGPDSVTHFSLIDDYVSLFGQYSVVGRSVVVHENEDDLGKGDYDDSPTTGHSGSRIACGPIVLAE